MPRSINCSHCIFANTSPPASGGPFGVLQTGCKTWRLDHYISTGKAERPQVDPETGEVYAFYGLSKFCNMLRTSEWAKTSSEGASYEELILKAEYENKCSFGIVIEISDESEDDLKHTVESIKNINYAKEKLTVTFSVVQKSLHTQIYLNLVEELRQSGINCTLVMHSSSSEQFTSDKDAFMQSFVDKRSYLCKIKPGDNIDSNLMSFIEYVINKKLEAIISFEDENGVVFNHRGVVNKLYPDYQNYDLMNKDILEKSITQKNYRKYETKK